MWGRLRSAGWSIPALVWLASHLPAKGGGAILRVVQSKSSSIGADVGIGACRYKYCVTMENSLSADYITEKLWDGLVAGCVPVYLGPKTARDIVPDPHSFIM